MPTSALSVHSSFSSAHASHVHELDDSHVHVQVPRFFFSFFFFCPLMSFLFLSLHSLSPPSPVLHPLPPSPLRLPGSLTSPAAPSLLCHELRLYSATNSVFSLEKQIVESCLACGVRAGDVTRYKAGAICFISHTRERVHPVRICMCTCMCMCTCITSHTRTRERVYVYVYVRVCVRVRVQ